MRSRPGDYGVPARSTLHSLKMPSAPSSSMHRVCCISDWRRPTREWEATRQRLRPATATLIHILLYLGTVAKLVPQPGIDIPGSELHVAFAQRAITMPDQPAEQPAYFVSHTRAITSGRRTRNQIGNRHTKCVSRHVHFSIQRSFGLSALSAREAMSARSRATGSSASRST